MILPGVLRAPIRRHFIMPKDKIALTEHYSQYFFNGAKVLELFSCYESILPGFDLDTTVGVGRLLRNTVLLFSFCSLVLILSLKISILYRKHFVLYSCISYVNLCLKNY